MVKRARSPANVKPRRNSLKENKLHNLNNISLGPKLYLGKGWEKGAEDSGVRETVGKERKSGVSRWDKMGKSLVIRKKKE